MKCDLKMCIILDITYITLISLNIIFHCVGIYILNCLRVAHDQTNEQVFIVSLSAAEIFGNITFLVHQSLQMSRYNKAAEYAKYAILGGVYVLYYLSMACLVLDKLLIVILHIRYPVYINETKVNTLIIATWIIGLLTIINVPIAFHFTHFNEMILKYLHVAFAIAFVIFVIMIYCIIFNKYMQSLFVPQPEYSGTCVSTLLIISFILFFILPQIFHLFINDSRMYRIFAICVQILCGCHVFIYVFMQPNAKRLLQEKLGYQRTEETAVREPRLSTINQNVLQEKLGYQRTEETAVREPRLSIQNVLYEVGDFESTQLQEEEEGVVTIEQDSEDPLPDGEPIVDEVGLPETEATEDTERAESVEIEPEVETMEAGGIQEKETTEAVEGEIEEGAINSEVSEEVPPNTESTGTEAQDVEIKEST